MKMDILCVRDCNALSLKRMSVFGFSVVVVCFCFCCFFCFCFVWVLLCVFVVVFCLFVFCGRLLFSLGFFGGFGLILRVFFV